MERRINKQRQREGKRGEQARLLKQVVEHITNGSYRKWMRENDKSEQKKILHIRKTEILTIKCSSARLTLIRKKKSYFNMSL